MPKVNWNDVEERTFELIPEGQYVAKIESVEVKETDKKDEMWKVKLNIEEGDYKGKKLFTNLVFNDGGYGNIKKLYSAVFGTKLPKNCETSDIIDEVVKVDVVHNEYNNKTYANIPYAGFYAVDEDGDPFK